MVAYGTVDAGRTFAGQRGAFRAQFPALPPGPYWIFLGRIHLKKGVDHLLEAYAALAAQPGVSLPALVIAGPCAEPGYLRQLQARAAACCPAGRVVWPGMLRGDAKWDALQGAEAFVLPSHQENFGIAVAEALSCGTPVLISDKVNIWREIAGDAAGLVGTDDHAGTLGLLTRWLALPAPARSLMQRAARKSFERRFAIEAAAASLAGEIGAQLRVPAGPLAPTAA